MGHYVRNSGGGSRILGLMALEKKGEREGEPFKSACSERT